jgi:hypothetical protein
MSLERLQDAERLFLTKTQESLWANMLHYETLINFQTVAVQSLAMQQLEDRQALMKESLKNGQPLRLKALAMRQHMERESLLAKHMVARREFMHKHGANKRQVLLDHSKLVRAQIFEFKALKDKRKQDADTPKAKKRRA